MRQEYAIDIATNPGIHAIGVIVDVLTFTSDQYHNSEDGESHLTDSLWDNLYRFLQVTDPVNKYLIGVGSEVRGGAGVPLPYVMPGLDQVHEGDTVKWIMTNNLMGATIITMDKMDGNSGQIIYDTNGNLQMAFSRGSSTDGQDLTRHFKRMKNLPTINVGTDLHTSIAVRVEVEMKEEVFNDLNDRGLINKRSGEKQSNARNYIGGQMNSTEATQIFYDNVDVIAYEIMFPLMDTKKEELTALGLYGFTVVKWSEHIGGTLGDDMLTAALEQAHKTTPWAIDGFVMIPNDRAVRDAIPARKGSSLNPVHTKKFKVGQDDNVAGTTVIKVEWKVSKDGYLKPTVCIDPVDLAGVTISKATGINAKYIYDNKIGPGSKVSITRAGDVIPRLLSSSPMPEQNMD